MPLGGQHDDRQRRGHRVGAQPPGQLQPVDAGASSGRPRPGRAAARSISSSASSPSLACEHLEAVQPQVELDEPGDVLVVVDDQDRSSLAVGLGRPRSGPGRRALRQRPQLPDRLGRVGGAVDRGAGDERVGARLRPPARWCRRRSRRRPRCAAPGGRRRRAGGRVRTLSSSSRDEPLPAEARLDRHDQQRVEVRQQVQVRLDRGVPVDRQARPWRRPRAGPWPAPPGRRTPRRGR